MYKKLPLLFLLIATLLPLTSCNIPPEPPLSTEIPVFVMDTVATINIIGEYTEEGGGALTAAVDLLHELDKTFSYTNPNSELSQINAAAHKSPVSISPHMEAVLTHGLKMTGRTGGAFDIGLGKLIDLWSDDVEPSASDIDELLPYLGSYGKVMVRDGKVAFSNEHIKLHLGAIAKGYAADMVIDCLRSHGVESAIVDVGGEIAVLGYSTRSDGAWHIGIRNPLDTAVPIITTVELDYGGVATSGAYERGNHILDPRTGKPVQSEFASVTVISPTAHTSDPLSTAIYVLGNEFDKHIRFAGYCVVLVSHEGEITYIHSDDCITCHNSGGNGSPDLD